MNIITGDFETFYSKQFGFSKMTTEEYVRHDDFEVIGVSLAVNDEETRWVTGTHEEIRKELLAYDWDNSFFLAHNVAFDGAILNWIFNIKPRGYLDTLSMGRAICGVEVGGSLKALAERYELGAKGTEVTKAEGKHRLDFTVEELATYGLYCRNDTEICRALFNRFVYGLGFPKKELKVIDLTIRMFVEPELVLDPTLLEEHLASVVAKKEKLMAAMDGMADKDGLMSNNKFAEILIKLGVEPPMKVSPRTGKQAYAFSKTDEAFTELTEHPDVRVQALVAARLGIKTTLEETRTERFIGIAKRGPLPVALKYYGAKPGRWSGQDKVNMQNLQSRGKDAGKLKKAILAPEGYVIIDCDSSQIEARTLAWFAGQEDLVKAFADGQDVYKIMASAIYGKSTEEISKEERFLGKTVVLGCGYGTGWAKLKTTLKLAGVDLDEAECRRIIDVYRQTYSKIPALWKQTQGCLEAIVTGNAASVGTVEGVIEFDATENGFKYPSGLWIRYDELKWVEQDGKKNLMYKARNGMVKIHGPKCVENLIQGVARCIIAEQMVKISKRYKVVLTVHDAIAIIAPKDEALSAQMFVEECMRWNPAWATGLPLNCESGGGASYGDC